MVTLTSSTTFLVYGREDPAAWDEIKDLSRCSDTEAIFTYSLKPLDQAEELEWKYEGPVHEATRAFLSSLRRLFDDFHLQDTILAAPVLSWTLLKYRNQINIKNLRFSQEQKISQQDFSALIMLRDTEISLLNAENKSQRDQFGVQASLLDEATEEARLANNAKSLAEEHSRKNIAELNSCIIDRDKIIDERDRSLAKAAERVQIAERTKKTLEDKFKSSRSDHDLALYI